MEIIELVRQLCREIQKDQRYINLEGCKRRWEQDESLQKLICELNLKKLALSQETSRKNVDKTKVETINEDIKICYNKIINNENMKNYSKAQEQMSKLINDITAAVNESIDI